MHSRSRNSISVSELAVFGVLGAVMFVSKLMMEWIPNVHLLGMFTMTFTIVYRKKALIPLYVYVLLNGIYAGFAVWWIPYLYIFTVLWGVTMLLPQKMKKPVAVIVYMLVCGLHGLAFGLLYAPSQALFFGFSFKTTIAWVISGLPWDVVHGIGNFAAGTLIVPLSSLIRRIDPSLNRNT